MLRPGPAEHDRLHLPNPELVLRGDHRAADLGQEHFGSRRLGERIGPQPRPAEKSRPLADHHGQVRLVDQQIDQQADLSRLGRAPATDQRRGGAGAQHQARRLQTGRVASGEDLVDQLPVDRGGEHVSGLLGIIVERDEVERPILPQHVEFPHRLKADQLGQLVVGSGG